MTKTIKILKEVKNQKDNPFIKMRSEDAQWLREHCNSIIYWIAELQASDEQLYSTLTTVRDDMFGKSSHKGQKNTALSALAGAAEKLRRGDLSQKQIDHITPLLDAAVNHNFVQVVFVDGLQPKSNFEKLFA